MIKIDPFINLESWRLLVKEHITKIAKIKPRLYIYFSKVVIFFGLIVSVFVNQSTVQSGRVSRGGYGALVVGAGEG